jgi:hypothetical protein
VRTGGCIIDADAVAAGGLTLPVVDNHTRMVYVWMVLLGNICFGTPDRINLNRQVTQCSRECNCIMVFLVDRKGCSKVKHFEPTFQDTARACFRSCSIVGYFWMSVSMMQFSAVNEFLTIFIVINTWVQNDSELSLSAHEENKSFRLSCDLVRTFLSLQKLVLLAANIVSIGKERSVKVASMTSTKARATIRVRRDHVPCSDTGFTFPARKSEHHKIGFAGCAAPLAADTAVSWILGVATVPSQAMDSLVAHFFSARTTAARIWKLAKAGTWR